MYSGDRISGGKSSRLKSSLIITWFHPDSFKTEMFLSCNSRREKKRKEHFAAVAHSVAPRPLVSFQPRNNAKLLFPLGLGYNVNFLTLQNLFYAVDLCTAISFSAVKQDLGRRWAFCS